MSLDGAREQLPGAGGVAIGLLSGGHGPALLLVHGGMSQLEAWEPLWPALSQRWAVSAIDRRGRGSSGDGPDYGIELEYEDVRLAAAWLAARHGGPVDVLGHSYGAVCVLGAAARAAPFRRIVLYEPPGPATLPAGWLEGAEELIAAGRLGAAMVSFLEEVIGLGPEQIEELRGTPIRYDVMRILSRTLSREARQLANLRLTVGAERVSAPVLLLLGERSPPWAAQITRELAGALPDARVATLRGQGHEAVSGAPESIAGELERFLLGDRGQRAGATVR